MIGRTRKLQRTTVRNPDQHPRGYIFEEQHNSDGVDPEFERRDSEHIVVEKYIVDHTERSMISDAEKGLPFKRVVNCILPPYNSCDRKEYVTIVQNLFRDTLATKNNKEFLLVMCQTGDFNTIPNQLVVSLLFQLLLDNNSAKPVAEKIRLVSMDKNICNLFKLELSKVYAKHRSELEFERVRLYEIENEILY